MPKKINHGSKVSFHYTGTLESGEVFDSSKGREPLTFEFGKGSIIPGLEKEMAGMETGEKKTIDVNSEDAYGERRDDMIREVPKGPVPPGMKLEKGTMLYLKGPGGMPIPATIVDVAETTIKLDFNHPLAGKKLRFEIEIVNVE